MTATLNDRVIVLESKLDRCTYRYVGWQSGRLMIVRYTAAVSGRVGSVLHSNVLSCTSSSFSCSYKEVMLGPSFSSGITMTAALNVRVIVLECQLDRCTYRYVGWRTRWMLVHSNCSRSHGLFGFIWIYFYLFIKETEVEPDEQDGARCRRWNDRTHVCREREYTLTYPLQDWIYANVSIAGLNIR
jgi:hypothetical protein